MTLCVEESSGGSSSDTTNCYIILGTVSYHRRKDVKNKSSPDYPDISNHQIETLSQSKNPLLESESITFYIYLKDCLFLFHN